MKRALKMHLFLYKINLEITDLNPTLESWTGDYIDAMETIRKGKKNSISSKILKQNIRTQ